MVFCLEEIAEMRCDAMRRVVGRVAGVSETMIGVDRRP